MNCESCRKREATVVFTKIVDSEKKVVHLCQSCLAQQNVQVKPKGAAPAEAPAPAAAPQAQAPPAAAASPALQCSVCGLTYEEFRKGGRLGCHACYEAFEEPLERLMKRVHGATAHVGKHRVPGRSAVPAADELQHLRHELEVAVAAEAYEQAADLRDRIRELEAAGRGRGAA